MKPAPFDYYAPDTLDEVLALLVEKGEDAKVLSGGQSLVPMLNMRLTRFAALVDIGRVAELQTMRADDGGITIGATVRQCDVETNGDVAAVVPLLAAATPLIGHFQIRSRGTVGGSLAHADPAAEYPAVSVALDAGMELTGPGGRRVVPASDFFLGYWTTTAEPVEVLTSVRFPRWGPGSGFAVEEVARRHGDFALAGVCVGIRLVAGKVDRAALCFFAMDATPVRAEKAEQALIGCSPADIAIDEIAALAVADLDPPGDLHASSALRLRIGSAVTVRALRRAIEEALVDE